MIQGYAKHTRCICLLSNTKPVSTYSFSCCLKFYTAVFQVSFNLLVMQWPVYHLCIWLRSISFCWWEWQVTFTPYPLIAHHLLHTLEKIKKYTSGTVRQSIAKSPAYTSGFNLPDTIPYPLYEPMTKCPWKNQLRQGIKSDLCKFLQTIKKGVFQHNRLHSCSAS